MSVARFRGGTGRSMRSANRGPRSGIRRGRRGRSRRASGSGTTRPVRRDAIHEEGRTARRPDSSRTNADDRLPLDPLGRIEGRNGIVEGRDVADVRPHSSVPHPPGRPHSDSGAVLRRSSSHVVSGLSANPSANAWMNASMFRDCPGDLETLRATRRIRDRVCGRTYRRRQRADVMSRVTDPVGGPDAPIRHRRARH